MGARPARDEVSWFPSIPPFAVPSQAHRADPIPPLFERMDGIRRLARTLIRNAAAELVPFAADGALSRLPIRLETTGRNELRP